MAKERWWTEIASEALREAIEIAGGQNKLARALKPKHPTINQQKLHQWLQRGFASADEGMCISIEEVTGVPKERLRPDVYPSAETVERKPEREGATS